MPEPPLLTHVDSSGLATITLNRPQVHNAFDDALIEALHGALDALDNDPGARVIELRAAGKSFSAGGDLNWMRRVAAFGHDENVADARKLAAVLKRLHAHPKPTLAVVQGAAFGGGVGLIACCDLVVASATAVFSFSEVKLGLIPATISPFVIASIGARQARRYFLTGERFDAETARALGLVHEVAADAAALDAVGERFTQALLAYGPETLRNIKTLVDNVNGRDLDAALLEHTARAIATQRGSSEGREGINAFLEKRKPRWPG